MLLRTEWLEDFALSGRKSLGLKAGIPIAVGASMHIGTRSQPVYEPRIW